MEEPRGDAATALPSFSLDPPPLVVPASDALRMETTGAGILVSRCPTLTEEDISHFVAALHARAAERCRTRSAAWARKRPAEARRESDGTREPDADSGGAGEIHPCGAERQKGSGEDSGVCAVCLPEERGGGDNCGADRDTEGEREDEIVGVALRGVGLQDDSLAILVTCMLRSTFLRAIDLSDNRLTDDSVSILAECLPCLPYLRFLNLANNRLSAASLIKVAKAFFPDFSTPPPRTSGPAKARATAPEAIAAPAESGARPEESQGGGGEEEAKPDVYHLDLSDTLVGADGCCAIAETIKCNSCPARLYLRNVGGGCAGLLPLIATESFLKALDFSHADMSPRPPSPVSVSPRGSTASATRVSAAPSAFCSSPSSFPAPPVPSSPSQLADSRAKSRGGVLFRSLQKARLARRRGLAAQAEAGQRTEPSGGGDKANEGGKQKQAEEEEWMGELEGYSLHSDDQRARRERNSLAGGDLQMLLCVAEGLAHLLTSAGALQELNLSYCTWSFTPEWEDDGEAPGASVQYADQLIDILAEALRETSSLRSLAFAGNGMTAVGLRRLCEGLASPACRLEELNLACNDLQETLPLAELLVMNDTIRILDIANCVLDSAAVNDLATALEANTTLAVLVLAHNALQPETLNKLTAALRMQRRRVEEAESEAPPERNPPEGEQGNEKREARGEGEETLGRSSAVSRFCGFSSQADGWLCCCSWEGTPPNPFNEPSSFSPRMPLAPAARQRLLSARRRCALHLLARQEAFLSQNSLSMPRPSAAVVCGACGGRRAVRRGEDQTPPRNLPRVAEDVELPNAPLTQLPRRGLRMLDLSYTTPHNSAALRPLAAAVSELPYLHFVDISSCAVDGATVEMLRAATAARAPTSSAVRPARRTQSPASSFAPAPPSVAVSFPYALSVRGLPLTAIRLDEDDELLEGVPHADEPLSLRGSESLATSGGSAEAAPWRRDAASTPDAFLADGSGLKRTACSLDSSRFSEDAETCHGTASSVSAEARAPGGCAPSAMPPEREGREAAFGDEVSPLRHVSCPPLPGAPFAPFAEAQTAPTASATAQALEEEKALLRLYSERLSPMRPPLQEQLKELEALQAQQIQLQRKKEELERHLLSQLKPEGADGEMHAPTAQALQDPVDWLQTPPDARDGCEEVASRGEA
ncbi:leucine rich repeat-containing protein [Besnoitia besnoiti]|uniref:Leucine rich repeat-containing protein n=1 Tax=Besnoitia besnoiti TaxID=94643 RepID=A0A2A9M9E6_BESBE|nr:leucine rich repeat-containing protein [Besnoitia besnoiti]PFH32237.1 leucine rich repeat-containing protein [Besnoitia besnoiti]